MGCVGVVRVRRVGVRRVRVVRVRPVGVRRVRVVAVRRVRMRRVSMSAACAAGDWASRTDPGTVRGIRAVSRELGACGWAAVDAVACGSCSCIGAWRRVRVRPVGVRRVAVRRVAMRRVAVWRVAVAATTAASALQPTDRGWERSVLHGSAERDGIGGRHWMHTDIGAPLIYLIALDCADCGRRRSTALFTSTVPELEQELSWVIRSSGRRRRI